MFDSYARRARLAPAALASLPALFLLGGGLTSPDQLESIVAIGFGGIGLIICGIVRDRGRAIQDDLWRDQGGFPTLRRLQWARSTDASATGRLHERMGDAVGMSLPTREEEGANPAAATQRYNEAVAALRELTRAREQFPLVFEENTEYGFRRNSLGIRPYALGVAAVILAVSGVLALVHDGNQARYWLSSGVSTLAILWWGLAVGETWARRAGDLYAERLFESLAKLRQGTKKSD